MSSKSSSPKLPAPELNPQAVDVPGLIPGSSYAAMLRARAEEAIAASVHHASLSQQYLTLSQKFAALAEQAAGGDAVRVAAAYAQLRREVETGTPAAPIEAFQAPVAQAPTGASTVPVPSGKLPDGMAFLSPPAQVSLPEDTATRAASNGLPASLANPVAATPRVVQRPPASRRRRVRKLSVRGLLDRMRLIPVERAERIRVKARKSDLQPQVRKLGDELKQELKHGTKPAVISAVVVGLALVLLLLKQLAILEATPLPPIVAGFAPPTEEVIEEPVVEPMEEPGEQQETPVDEVPEPMEQMPEPELLPEPEPDPLPEPEPLPEPVTEPVTEPAPVAAELPPTPDGEVPVTPAAATAAASAEPRSEEGRKMLVEKYGGSAASESAVGFALEWLASRQRADGSWDFIDVGPCTQPGTINNPIGGTAYALLPFLAAGQTHREGIYKKNVRAGLDYLTKIGVAAPAGYDLRGVINRQDDDSDPNYAYYVHGAATLALCEAYWMTKDRQLRPAAEGAALFLVNSQDPRGGGWRYNPQQPGSTSCTAIQVMALKAAEKCGFRIPENTWKGVTYYLDSVSVDGAGRYGYEVSKKAFDTSVTSMALLSRVYLGWGRDNGDLRAGVALIDAKGPYENLYYDYFATQLMKNWGGPEWDRWNGRLRDDLIAWQETEGPAKGSWAPRDRADYSKSGGRLLTTCLATLTLEVYYRYQPLLPGTSTPKQVPPD